MAKPNPLLKPTWKKRTDETHTQHLAALKNSTDGQVLLLGSSMIERFLTSGKGELTKFSPFNCILAGVGGDGVQHMLYRLDKGLIEACPQTLHTVVLMAGTNNIEKFSEVQVFEGVSNLVTVIHGKRPHLKIIIFGLPPRESTVKQLTNRQILEKVQKFNALLEKIPQKNDKVKYYSFYDKLVYDTGNRMDSYFDDYVHLNSKGYTIFGDAIVAALQAE